MEGLCNPRRGDKSSRRKSLAHYLVVRNRSCWIKQRSGSSVKKVTSLIRQQLWLINMENRSSSWWRVRDLPNRNLIFSWFCSVIIDSGCTPWQYLLWLILRLFKQGFLDSHVSSLVESLYRKWGILVSITSSAMELIGYVYAVWYTLFWIMLCEPSHCWHTMAKPIMVHKWFCSMLYEFKCQMTWTTSFHPTPICQRFDFEKEQGMRS